MAQFTNTISDETTETGGGFDVFSILEKGAGQVLNTGNDLLRKAVGLTPNEDPAVAGPNPVQYPQQQAPVPPQAESGGITSMVKGVSPLIWGGAGAAISYLLWHKPLWSALIGGGMWFLTDKMSK